MYYPIIDKLKEVMADITAVKDKEPLIIEGILTSATGGTWTGSYSDITRAFSNNIQVFFKIVVHGDTIIVPVFQYNVDFASSVCFPNDVGGNVFVAYGTIAANNTFELRLVN